jgi:uncharacterized HAD superfamily protein/adenine/guanine phosphoribosyltransferase-like PRPP-binding protein
LSTTSYQFMQFRGIADLERAMHTIALALPTDTELVVGIPRSGLLAASILALQMNLRLTDLEGLLEGRMLAKGFRATREADGRPRRVVVVDDSVNTGRELKRVREQIDAAGLDMDVTYAAAFVSRTAPDAVDIAAEVVDRPRVFSWNIMHRPEILARTCVDIDGVLCPDPHDHQNDDGPRYLEFLNDTRPLFIPSSPVRYVVTARLERYRPETERWLAARGIEYEQLVMMDLDDAEERRKVGGHARHKAAFYAESDTDLFIESDYGQAAEIAQVAGRQVYALDRKEMLYPSPGRALAAAPAAFARSATRTPPVQALLYGVRDRAPDPLLKLVRRARGRARRG